MKLGVWPPKARWGRFLDTSRAVLSAAAIACLIGWPEWTISEILLDIALREDPLISGILIPQMFQHNTRFSRLRIDKCEDL